MKYSLVFLVFQICVSANHALGGLRPEQTLKVNHNKHLVHNRKHGRFIPSELTLLAEAGNQNAVSEHLRSNLQNDFILFVSAISAGLGTSCVLHSTRKFIAAVERLSEHVPISLFHLAIGGSICILHYLQSDLIKGPATLINSLQSDNLSRNSVLRPQNLFSLRRQIIRWSAFSLTVAGKLPFGMAGPAAEMGASIASLLSALFVGLDVDRRNELLLAGAAAGIAVCNSSRLSTGQFILNVRLVDETSSVGEL